MKIVEYKGNIDLLKAVILKDLIAQSLPKNDIQGYVDILRFLELKVSDLKKENNFIFENEEISFANIDKELNILNGIFRLHLNSEQQKRQSDILLKLIRTIVQSKGRPAIFADLDNRLDYRLSIRNLILKGEIDFVKTGFIINQNDRYINNVKKVIEEYLDRIKPSIDTI